LIKGRRACEASDPFQVSFAISLATDAVRYQLWD
jgi:hypothetical protein